MNPWTLLHVEYMKETSVTKAVKRVHDCFLGGCAYETIPSSAT